MSILRENQPFESYNVQTFIKKGMYDETYFITDSEGKRHFLKLFITAEMPKDIFGDDGMPKEVQLMKRLDHPNLIRFEKYDTANVDGTAYPYVITEFVPGELVETRLMSGSPFSVEEVVEIAMHVLGGLAFMHSKKLMHCDITPRNIIINKEGEEYNATLIDLGHLSEYPLSKPDFLITDLEPWYRAPETFWEGFGPEADVFSFAAVIYAMLYGKAPWEDDSLKEGDSDKDVRTKLYNARKAALSFEGRDDVPDWLKKVLAKALHIKKEKRIDSAERLLNIMATPDKADEQPQRPREEPSGPEGGQNKGDSEGPKDSGRDERGQISANIEFKVAIGGGFADVAGMEELKLRLQQRVLFVLKNKKKAEAYKLAIPNGMLLYGPPGCGKTYFAQKFAEESGFKFSFVKSSDLGSVFIHGSQTMIADMFKKAEQNQPAIVCIDEIDALLPRRGAIGTEHTSSEVNEFLSQMNECGKRGIFVIGTTNRPSLIDTAALRKGRFDIIEYVPAPDERTRKLMFDLYLKDRPCTEIDTQALSVATEHYVASDIAYIVNDAALISALRDEAITYDTILKCIHNTTPSLNEKVLNEYSHMKDELAGSIAKGGRVGFQAILDNDATR